MGSTLDPETVCRQYGSSILRRSELILRDRSAAEDAAQDVFMVLLKKRPRLRDDSAAAAFVYRLTTRVCLNRLRTEQRLKTREATGGRDLGGGSVDPYAAYEARETLATRLAELAPLDQAIFIHRFFDGMTQEQIAQVTGRSRRTIGKRLRRLEQEGPRSAR